MNPIEKVVAPLKNDAIERAEQNAKEIIDDVKKQLLEAGNDLKICAPYPRSNMYNAYSPAYWIAASKYQLFRSLCKTRKGSHMMNEPILADMDSNYKAKFIKQAKEDAAAQYDAFVAKLVVKIGEVEDAKLVGNHVWSFSILSVTKKDGTTQNWKTQQIINVSKYGKLFNQWPTRKVK